MSIAKAIVGTTAAIFTAGIAGGMAIADASAPEPVETVQIVREVEKVEVPRVITVREVEVLERIPEIELKEYEKEMIARVVYAEAPYEDPIGQRLVVDCILNRVEDPDFPNTVSGVIYQENQFCKAAIYSPECMAAVEAEMYERIDRRVAWFCNQGFMPYGEPAYQHGAHYFCWLE